MDSDLAIAYFSMEISLEPAMPTYCGGLGFLAGDLLRSAADSGVQLAGVSLVHRKGYFRQQLGSDGSQTEESCNWVVENHLTELPVRVAVRIENREVMVRAWLYQVIGTKGKKVPVYLLDTDLPENSAWDRRLTDHLYGGDPWYRLCQEIVLGIGGVRVLRALGHDDLNRYHMNEGHAGLLAMELLDEAARKGGREQILHEDVEVVRQKCVFTTHTPVPAGHDKFPVEMVTAALGRNELSEMHEIFCFEGELNMTYLALNLSHFVNGVAKSHAEVSQRLFAGYRIEDITNGVHVSTWAAPSFQRLFDGYLPGWREDNFVLRNSLGLPSDQVWSAHQEAKDALFDRVFHDTGVSMDLNVLTYGFARRIADYKRADLLFYDLDRLRSLADLEGGLQIVFAGKAHPGDSVGRETIRTIFRAIQQLQGKICIAYLPDYNWELGRLMTSGVDVWLNTPLPPREASGTSGMKAAVNGVPSLSVLDGWWIEGCIEGITGWAIGPVVCPEDRERSAAMDSDFLYEKMERVVNPIYYQDRAAFTNVMRHAIALNGAFFNSQRMLLQYVLNAYFD
ncbi:MAG: alpha-glucan family phosphorylase [Verrucomicrobiaceae bacterium]|nr:MAG: alpha-glucan family phosphorylase [Verrucomicrobiaceae bacterium]